MSEIAQIESENFQDSLLLEKFNGLNVQIYGTYEEPLFKAKDIGNLLGIEKIRKSIENLDDECKIIKAAPTGGGLQEQWLFV